ncbi:MAG: heavy metal-binding domain-containing protein, partial [Atribacterota bacterium]|nr:heavy metal-binding domain-containing protein [Atribacterota bacterium]
MRLNTKLKQKWLAGILLLLLATTALYLGTQQPRRGPSKTEEPVVRQQIQRKIKFWTCSMHPQIKLPKSGKCPICNMDLIPVYEELSDYEEPFGEEAG